MKCPACVAGGQKSILTETRLKAPPEGGLVERFYDEDGAKHVHDHTMHLVVLTCSLKHSYAQKMQGRCANKDCAWNQQETVLAQQRPIGAARQEAQEQKPFLAFCAEVGKAQGIDGA